jgi:hypothetical protein
MARHGAEHHRASQRRAPWSREAIADWLETIEAQYEAEQVVPALVTA